MRGIIAVQSKAATSCHCQLYQGLFGLQARGQEYCGMATRTERVYKIRTHRGMVVPQFGDDLSGLEGFCGIGATTNSDRQPIKSYRTGRRPFFCAHDGFVRNSRSLWEQMLKTGACPSELDDIWLLANIVSREKQILSGIARAMEIVNGGFSLVIMEKGSVYAARSINGMNPLVLGESEDSWVAASESTAFPFGDWGMLRDVNPGEIVHIGRQGIETLAQLEGPRHICSFTWIYFAQPDSISDGVPVALVRHRIGSLLAEGDNIEADVVAPVPFSGIMHAEGYHLASGLPLVVVFKLPQFVQRTYNLALKNRLSQQDIKLRSIVGENVAGKRIVLVDDSIRAGIIMTGIIDRLRQCGAMEVHVRVASPVSLQNCPWAARPRNGEKYIARDHSVEEIRRIIGADTLRFLKFEDVSRAIGLPAKDLCLECFLRG